MLAGEVLRLRDANTQLKRKNRRLVELAKHLKGLAAIFAKHAGS